MIDNVATKSGFSLLKWLPVVAAAALTATLAPKAVLAQSTPSTIGYVVSDCGIISDRGDYYYIGTDADGDPYYESAAGVYLFMGGDDQDNRNYDRWYICPGAPQIINGEAEFGEGGDYESGDVGGYYVGESYEGPASPIGWNDDSDDDGTPPTVTSM